MYRILILFYCLRQISFRVVYDFLKNLKWICWQISSAIIYFYNSKLILILFSWKYQMICTYKIWDYSIQYDRIFWIFLTDQHLYSLKCAECLKPVGGIVLSCVNSGGIRPSDQIWPSRPPWRPLTANRESSILTSCTPTWECVPSGYIQPPPPASLWEESWTVAVL